MTRLRGTRGARRGAGVVLMAGLLLLGAFGTHAVGQQIPIPPAPDAPPIPTPPPDPDPVPPPAPNPIPTPTPAAPAPATPAPSPPATSPAPSGPTAAERAAAARRAALRRERARALEARRRAAAERRDRRAATQADVVAASLIGTARAVPRTTEAAVADASANDGDDSAGVGRAIVLAALSFAFVCSIALGIAAAVRRRTTRDGDPTVRTRAGPGLARRVAGRPMVTTFATTAAMLGVNLVTGVIIARALGPDGRGEVSAILALPQTLAWLFAFGAFQAIVYHQSRNPRDAPSVLGTWLAVTIPLGLLAVVVGEVLVPVLLGAQTPDAIALGRVYVGLTLVTLFSSVFLGIVLGDREFGFYNGIRLCQSLGIAAGYLVLWPLGALTVGAALAVTATVLLISLVVVAAKVVRRHGVTRPDRGLLRTTGWFGVRAHATDLSGVGNLRLDLTVIPAFLVATQVGLYAVAATIAGILMSLAGSTAAVVLPTAARDRAGAPRVVARAAVAALGVCGAIGAVLWIFAPYAIELVYGDDFSGSVELLRILIPGAVLFGAAGIVGQGLTALGRPFTAAAGQLVGLAITVIGLLLLLPDGGVRAAAWVSLGAYAAVFLVTSVLYIVVARRGAVAEPHGVGAAPAAVEHARPRRAARERPAPGPAPLAAARAFARAHPGARDTIAFALGLVAMAFVVGAAVATEGNARVAIVGAVLALVAGLGVASSRLLLPALVVWLAGLGLLRRMVTELIEPTAQDLLLLVGPTLVIVLVIGTHRTDRTIRDRPLSKLVAVFGVLVFLAAVNPLGGSPLAGASSLLFVLIPVLGYWVGTRIDDTTLLRVLALMAGLGVVTGLYGLYQTFSGFPSWDQTWIDTSGYAALRVGKDTVRAFSTFSSSSEYTIYLAIAIVVLLAFAFRRARFVPILIVPLTMLVIALFYVGSRAPIFKIVAAFALMVAAYRGMRLVSALAVATVLIVLVPTVVAAVAPAQSDNALVTRQVEGLSNPTSSEDSTIGFYVVLLRDSFVDSFTQPLGSGLARVTIAGDKFGGETLTTETDPATAAVAMGLPGLAVFLAILGLGFVRAYTLARRRRDFLALAGLGILVVTLLQWLAGGQYAVALLPWLVIGWAEARSRPRRSRRAGHAPVEVDDPHHAEMVGAR
ncbi:oligosaccharide flippase family protein [Miltoncostaea oceani]|uniref:oligosaccharide flippase family protein n=1 Tax=Miltoncostaea oceani TaxID=2843216 RepID=UPI001C3DB091|nr:oligosaccharide flippase family protein [Miltoncostaea oceani]